MPSAKRIVCDTGPLLHLREAESLDLLRVAGQVLIPPIVEDEAASLDAEWGRFRPAWIEVVPLRPPYNNQASNWIRALVLDPGEAEALALASQLQADWLLTDDMAARLLAKHEGLEVHGSLGVVLWAAATGELDRAGAERALEALFRSSLWISAQIMDEARAALRQIFS